jgi:AraC family transcriptional regulator
MIRLGRGEYLGRTLRSSRVAGLPLTVTFYPPGLISPWHVHENPTLFLLLSGEHRDETRQRTFGQPPLSVVYHPTTGPHTTRIGPTGLVGLNLELQDADLESHHLRRRDLPGEYRLLDAPEARMLGLRLTASTMEDSESAEAEAAVVELLAMLLPTPVPHSPTWLPRAKEFLHEHASHGVRLTTLAAEVGVHPVYCARAFRKAVGCTVMDYARVLRLIDAGQLILENGLSLAEVACRAGFADQAHLTRECTRTLHAAPGRLRRLLRELWSESAGSNGSRRLV